MEKKNILKVEIELDSIFNDDGSLADSIIRSVKDEVLYEIKNTYFNEAKNIIAQEVIKESERKLNFIVDQKIDELIQDPEFKIKKSNYTNETTTIPEMVREKTLDVLSEGKIIKIIDTKMKSVINELKERYDMMFAASIVDALKKQNMLKDDRIADLLK